MNKIKKRTLNELRQVKEYGSGSKHMSTNTSENKPTPTIEKIKSLVDVTPNDAELGEKIRQLFFSHQNINLKEDTNIFGKIPGSKYKDLIENYQTKKGDEFNDWYRKLTNEEKIFITSMFD